MDVLSVSNNSYQQYMAESQRQQATVESFQAVLDKAAAGQSEKDDATLKEACESFESYFMQMMFREMRKTSFDDNGFIPKSQAEKMFTDMLDEEVSKSSARSGGIGLAEMMYKQMTKYNANTTSTEGLQMNYKDSPSNDIKDM